LYYSKPRLKDNQDNIVQTETCISRSKLTTQPQDKVELVDEYKCMIISKNYINSKIKNYTHV